MITIDDYFVCSSENAGPAFSRCHGNELWVLLLEKAYAKIFGNYMKIINGMSGKAINDLTGAPYESMDVENQKETLEYIQYGMKNNFLMTCASKSE